MEVQDANGKFLNVLVCQISGARISLEKRLQSTYINVGRRKKTFHNRAGGFMRLHTCICAAALMVVACGGDEPSSPTPSPQSRYIRQTAGANAVVIFVHGVFGNATDTWRNSATGASWPELLEKDSDLKPYDIYLVNYASPFVQASSNIEEIAQRVLQQLTDQKLFEYQRSYFIAHSMGGLIVKRIVSRLETPTRVQELRRVRATLFLSTPSQGAPITDVATWLSMNPQLGNMQPSDLNAFLQVLENDWQGLLRERDRLRETYPQAYCAYETLPTKGVRVVTRLYATSRCDNTPYGMDYDHLGIVKPADNASDPYPWAKARIQEADKLAEFSTKPLAVTIAQTQQFKEIKSATAPAPQVAKWSNALGDTYWVSAVKAPSPQDLNSAFVAYQTAASLDPLNALYPAKMGTSLNQLGKYGEAIANFRRAISLDATVGWYHGELCDALMRAGRVDEAATECQTAVRLEPENTAYQKQWEALVKPGPGRGLVVEPKGLEQMRLKPSAYGTAVAEPPSRRNSVASPALGPR